MYRSRQCVIFVQLVITLSLLYLLYLIFARPQSVDIENRSGDGPHSKRYLSEKCPNDKLLECHQGRTLAKNRVARLSLMSDLDDFHDHLLNPFLTVRVSGTSAIRTVQQHVRDQMRSFKWHVEDDHFTSQTPLGERDFTNIVATQNPSAPRKLTLACHVDSKYFRGIEFVGAIDSAVPCAMLLDLARVLNNSLWAPSEHKLSEVSIQFIFFDGEEAFEQWTDTDSLYGARHLAEKMSWDKIQNMDALILLDLIGTSDTEFISWFAKTDHLFERLRKIELRLNKQGLLQPESEFRGRKSSRYFKSDRYFHSDGIQDDHIPFLRKGARVLHLISYPFPSVWHTAKDDEAHIHYDTIENLNRILRVFVAEYLHLTP